MFEDLLNSEQSEKANAFANLIYSENKKFNLTGLNNIEEIKKVLIYESIHSLNYANINLEDSKQIKTFMDDLKSIYEDYWKKLNQINTSIKLTLNVRVDTTKDLKIEKFEKTLENIDLINNFSISRFNKNFIY